MPQDYRVLVIDDERANLESLARILRSDGAIVTTCEDPCQLEKLITDQEIILTDLKMEKMSGLQVLEQAKSINPSIEVILISAFGTVEVAVEAMKRHAYDFITKPLHRVQILHAVHQALGRRRLIQENNSLKQKLTLALERSHGLIGQAPVIEQVFEMARQAAKSRASVLIEGESGTGKGALAHLIHSQSDVSQGMFVNINCAAIPENLLEAELFGYEEGAFTGATKKKKGRLELAHEGSLFLDEIGLAPLSLQTKLLRFLQDGEFERLGSNHTLRLSTRVISATNSDLRSQIEKKLFREDLFYRLNVISVRMPPLRERKEDIPLLAQKFLDDFSRKNGTDPRIMTEELLDRLIHYHWPGNIRELQNVMERLVVLSSKTELSLSDLPLEIQCRQSSPSIFVPLGTPLKEVEKTLIRETLQQTEGNKQRAAKILGVHPRTISRLLEKQGGQKSLSHKEERIPSVSLSSPSANPAGKDSRITWEID